MSYFLFLKFYQESRKIFSEKCIDLIIKSDKIHLDVKISCSKIIF